MIIHCIKNAHNKSDVRAKSQRSATAVSMLYAYTFMMSDRSSVKQCGRHPQKGYLRTYCETTCQDTQVDLKNRMMVPILAPLTPCFQSSHKKIDSRVIKASGHGRVCITENEIRTTHPESFIDAVQFMMRFYHVHLNQSHEISDLDVLNKI